MTQNVGESLQFLIGATDANYLRVTILGWESSSEREWLNAEADVRSGGFSGRCRISLHFEALPRFRDELQTLAGKEKGVARLAPIEPTLTIGIQRDCFDTTEAVCTVCDDLGRGNELRTRFLVNAEQITTIVEELDRIVQAFPVVGR